MISSVAFDLSIFIWHYSTRVGLGYSLVNSGVVHSRDLAEVTPKCYACCFDYLGRNGRAATSLTRLPRFNLTRDRSGHAGTACLRTADLLIITRTELRGETGSLMRTYQGHRSPDFLSLEPLSCRFHQLSAVVTLEQCRTLAYSLLR